MKYKIIKLHALLLLLVCFSVYSQPSETRLKLSERSSPINRENTQLTFADSLEKKLVTKKSISAIFLSVGGGIAVPLTPFKDNSDVTFGTLGRIEFASTSIFPFVIGGEVDYFVFNGSDEFRTTNLLNTYKTKILSVGLNIEYSLSKIFRSSFTMPFLTVDVKSNMIKREYDESRTFDDLPREESKISIGAGFGFTLFIFDFYLKYNHMKGNPFIGVYTKIKVPVIRF